MLYTGIEEIFTRKYRSARPRSCTRAVYVFWICSNGEATKNCVLFFIKFPLAINYSNISRIFLFFFRHICIQIQIQIQYCADSVTVALTCEYCNDEQGKKATKRLLYVNYTSHLVHSSRQRMRLWEFLFSFYLLSSHFENVKWRWTVAVKTSAASKAQVVWRATSTSTLPFGDIHWMC